MPHVARATPWERLRIRAPSLPRLTSCGGQCGVARCADRRRPPRTSTRSGTDLGAWRQARTETPPLEFHLPERALPFGDRAPTIAAVLRLRARAATRRGVGGVRDGEEGGRKWRHQQALLAIGNHSSIISKNQQPATRNRRCSRWRACNLRAATAFAARDVRVRTRQLSRHLASSRFI